MNSNGVGDDTARSHQEVRRTRVILAVEHDVDREVLGDAISAGRDLVDAAVVALDSVSLAQPA